MTDKPIDITDWLQKIGQTVSEYKDTLENTFKEMDVEVKDWHFNIGKQEKEYNVEVNVELCMKPKKS